MADSYGIFDSTPNSFAATGGASIAAASNDAYTWPSDDAVPRNVSMGKVFIQNAPGSNSTLHIRWNHSTVSTTEWDAILVPGDHITSPDGILVNLVQVLATVATATYNTEFSIRGWPYRGSPA